MSETLAQMPQPDPGELERRLRSALAEAPLPAAPDTLRASLARVPLATSRRALIAPRWSSARGLLMAVVAVVAVALVGAGLTGRLTGPGASTPPALSVVPGSAVATGSPATSGPVGSPVAIVPWIDATPAPFASPIPRPVPPGTRTCGPADLTAVAFWGGATGTMAGGVTVTNVSTTACVLDGPPKSAVIKAGSTTMPTAFHGHPVVGLGGAPSTGPALLEPGDRGDWTLFWANWCGATLEPTRVVLTLPGGEGQIVAEADGTGPVPGIGGTPRCDAPGSPSSLDMNAFEYDPPQPPEVVPQPATATISAPPTAAIGADLAYTVTLVNNGDAAAVLDPCPVYDENLIIDGLALKLPGDQRHVLNCQAMGPSIAAGATVTLEMHYEVPGDLQPGAAELSWYADSPFDGASARVSIQLVAGSALSPVQRACPGNPAIVDPPSIDCAAAVSAALTRLVVMHPAIASIEVHRGVACAPNTRCYATPPGDMRGFVIVTYVSGDQVMVPVVGIGPGNVTAGAPRAWPLPACPDPSSLTPAPTLTCEAAVAAATPRLPVGHPEVFSTTFNFGTWCPPGAGCTPTLPDRGYVVFAFADREPLMVRVVMHASTGNIVASPAEPYPPTP